LNNVEPADGHARGGNDALIEEIIRLENPMHVFEHSVFETVKMIKKGDAGPTPDSLAKAQARREALKLMTPEALRNIRSRLLHTKDQQEEANRFYNHPKANADFKHWLAMDLWTIDQSVALLLGKDPRIVNRDAIDAYLAKPKAWLAKQNSQTAFTRRYLNLTQQAEGATAMTVAAKLEKLAVITWGQTVTGEDMPEALKALLHTAAPPTHTANHKQDDEPAKTIVTVAALRQLESRWPSVTTDLERASRNGLSQAAKLPGKNQWWKERAVDWADRHGKLKADKRGGSGSGLESWASGLRRGADE